MDFSEPTDFTVGKVDHIKTPLLQRMRKLFCVGRQEKKACQKNTTFFTVYRSTLKATVDEEYLGIYFCPGCDASTMIYRQRISAIETPLHKPDIKKDILRFEHRNTTNRNRKVVYVPIDGETSIRQLRKLEDFSSHGDTGGTWMTDERGVEYELLNERDIGFVDCAKCRHGVHLWVQVRRYHEGRNTKWGLAIKSREGKCFLETALGLWCKKQKAHRL